MKKELDFQLVQFSLTTEASAKFLVHVLKELDFQLVQFSLTTEASAKFLVHVFYRLAEDTVNR